MIIYVFGTRGFPDIQGGVEKHCEFLYPEIADNYEISIFRRKAFLSPNSPQTVGKIKFIDLPSTKVKGFEAFFHSFLCTIYCIFKRPDIIHIHNIGPGIFIPILKLFRLKVVLTYHSPNYEHKKWGYFARLVLKMGEFCSINGADAIVFVNKIQMQSFPARIRYKSFFIPNGIKKQTKSSYTNYIEELGLQPQQYILSVGRITQEKGFDYLIDAYTLTSSSSTYKLVIAGGADHNSEYAEQIRDKAKENDIILAGYVDGEKLRQLYSHARLFVLPSYNEGYPIVLVEAINFQLPILASNIKANTQINLPDHAYFPVGEVTILKEKIEIALQKTNIPSFYSQPLPTWNEIAKNVGQIYNKIYPWAYDYTHHTAIKEITVYTMGDSSLLSTWSNVPYFFTKALINKGFTVNRINIAPNQSIEYIYNHTILKLLSLIFKKHTFSYERTRVNRWLTNRVIKKSTQSYPNTDLNIFLTFSYSNIYSSKPSCLFGDWTYDQLIRDRQQRKPYFFENNFIHFENQQIEKAALVVSLFSKCTEYMKNMYTNRQIYHLGENVINSCYEGELNKDEILAIKRDSNKILFIGNSKYKEGAQLLINSFKMLLKKRPKLELHIIGLSQNTFSNIPENVYFYGYLKKEVPEERELYYNLMIQAKVFVNPTPVWGGYSSTIEAMYFYNPIIISPYEEFVHEFGTDISFGTYCNKFDEYYLSDRLYHLLNNHEYYLQLCHNAHEAVASYTWSSYIDKLVEKINNVV